MAKQFDELKGPDFEEIWQSCLDVEEDNIDS